MLQVLRGPINSRSLQRTRGRQIHPETAHAPSWVCLRRDCEPLLGLQHRQSHRKGMLSFQTAVLHLALVLEDRLSSTCLEQQRLLSLEQLPRAWCA